MMKLRRLRGVAGVFAFFPFVLSILPFETCSELSVEPGHVSSRKIWKRIFGGQVIAEKML